ncbi:IS110 family transposase (plasmid) [Embleya sp. NBC_00888]|uniref:hypothetical protein n=1 Tax=Embleya sp. NBC_00888 TaxID=2975960 RepID=UPI002F91585D|nr:IS110 family transposase [Embleya sp. NBC_00888]
MTAAHPASYAGLAPATKSSGTSIHGEHAPEQAVAVSVWAWNAWWFAMPRDDGTAESAKTIVRAADVTANLPW